MMHKIGVILYCLTWMAFLSISSIVKRDDNFLFFKAQKAAELEALLNQTFPE